MVVLLVLVNGVRKVDQLTMARDANAPSAATVTVIVSVVAAFGASKATLQRTLVPTSAPPAVADANVAPGGTGAVTSAQLLHRAALR